MIMMKTAMATRPPITPPAIAPTGVFALVAEAPLGALLLVVLLLAALVEEVVMLMGIL